MVPLAGFVHIAIAIYFAIHAVRSGQPTWWLFVLFAFPLLGSIVYFAAVWMPQARYTRGGIKAARAVQQFVDPNRELRESTVEFERTPTAYNRARLAGALLVKGRGDEAVSHYREAASGAYANDAAFLRGLAAAELAVGRPRDAATTLERLFAAHPGQQRGDLALMHAEALDAAGDPGAADAFAAVMAADGSTEAQFKYGQFRLRRGDTVAARTAFERVLRDAQLGHTHSRELNREWIAQAKDALAKLPA